MNVSIPDNIQQLVLAQVAKGGYGSVSDYIGELVRADHAQTSLEAEVMQGLASGESTPMTPAEWSDLRNRVRRQDRGTG